MRAIALLLAMGQNCTATLANCNSCCKGKEESCRHACSSQKAERCSRELGSSCTMHRGAPCWFSCLQHCGPIGTSRRKRCSEQGKSAAKPKASSKAQAGKGTRELPAAFRPSHLLPRASQGGNSLPFRSPPRHNPAGPPAAVSSPPRSSFPHPARLWRAAVGGGEGRTEPEG